LAEGPTAEKLRVLEKLTAESQDALKFCGGAPRPVVKPRSSIALALGVELVLASLNGRVAFTLSSLSKGGSPRRIGLCVRFLRRRFFPLPEVGVRLHPPVGRFGQVTGGEVFLGRHWNGARLVQVERRSGLAEGGLAFVLENVGEEKRGFAAVEMGGGFGKEFRTILGSKFLVGAKPAIVRHEQAMHGTELSGGVQRRTWLDVAQGCEV